MSPEDRRCVGYRIAAEFGPADYSDPHRAERDGSEVFVKVLAAGADPEVLAWESA